MFKKLLIIGYGSVGKKHYDILKKNFKEKIKTIVFSKISNKLFNKSSISKLKKIDPDYFILSTPSYLHFNHLKILCKHFNKKIILVEKPLFLKLQKINIKDNTVFVGYNLRFHPVIQYAKKFFKNKTIEAANIVCLTNVMNWRKKKKFFTPYSFSQSKSGGVLFDLSHEIDYFTWIFGKIKKKYSLYKKISKYKKIDAKDYFYLIGNNKKCKSISINLDFLSSIEKRDFEIFYKDYVFIGDILKNKITILKKNNIYKVIKFNNFKIFNTFEKQIKNTFFDNKKITCSYKEGLNLTSNILSFIK